MVHVRNISKEEARTFLQRVKFGHLAYAYEGQPYIVPIHFGYDGDNIYFLTTDGTKTRILSANPKICLQVEQVDDFEHWQSVMVTGRAERLINLNDIERATGYLKERKLTSPPEMNKATLITTADDTSEVSIYCIRPQEITGRERIEVAA